LDQEKYPFQALWDFYDTLLDVHCHQQTVADILEDMSQRDKALLCNLAQVLPTSGTTAIRPFLYSCREGNEALRCMAVTQSLSLRMGRITVGDLSQLVVCAHNSCTLTGSN
jgi:hypothetical protein